MCRLLLSFLRCNYKQGYSGCYWSLLSGSILHKSTPWKWSLHCKLIPSVCKAGLDWVCTQDVFKEENFYAIFRGRVPLNIEAAKNNRGKLWLLCLPIDLVGATGKRGNRTFLMSPWEKRIPPHAGLAYQGQTLLPWHLLFCMQDANFV